MSNLLPLNGRIYLDHAAATPLRSEVYAAMLPFLTTSFANPGAVHQEGLFAKLAISEARQKIAQALSIKPEGIIFTGSGTESNNLAILGFINQLNLSGKDFTDMEILTTRLEHPSILNLLPQLVAKGVRINNVAVDDVGQIVIEDFAAKLSPKTVLVTFAYANSEIGVIQEVSRLVRKVRQFEREQQVKIAVHLDAAQAPLWLPCGLEQLGADMISLDAGKCQGPKGVGVLALRNIEQLSPIMFGGGQESGLRPGTENVAGIVGAGLAISLALKDYETRSQTVIVVRDHAFEVLKEKLPLAQLNGPVGDRRLANNVNFSIPGLDTEYAVIALDAHGVAASTKSACAGAAFGVSHVVLEMTQDEGRAKSTIRITLGEETKKTDIDYALGYLVEHCKKMKILTI